MNTYRCENCETPYQTPEESDECCACEQCAELEIEINNLKETYHKKLSAYRRFAAIMICKNLDHQYTLEDCLDEKNQVFK